MGARTVLGDDDARDAQVGAVIARGLRLVSRAVEKHNDVGVLLDGARFTQVGELRALAGAALDGTRELRQRE